MSSEALRLVGHEEARRAVLFALSRGRLGQALLLVGEEGIGKRRFANWVLAARWCPHAERPCGEGASHFLERVLADRIFRRLAHGFV